MRVDWPFLPGDYTNWDELEAVERRNKTTLKLRGRASTNRWADAATNRTLTVYGESHEGVLHTLKSVLKASIHMGLDTDALKVSPYWRQAIGDMRELVQ